MFKDIFYAVKMIALTILVCMALQVKVGQFTVEHEIYAWMQTSVLIDYIETAIAGGASITKTGYKQMHAVVSKALTKMSRHNKTSERGITFALKRHNQKNDEEDDLQEDFLPKVKVPARQIK